jgi:6-phosphogluconate dehydrogenase (decarboxylating)
MARLAPRGLLRQHAGGSQHCLEVRPDSSVRDEGVPVPMLRTALHGRFSSRGAAEFQDKLSSAVRYEFDGHIEKSADT